MSARDCVAVAAEQMEAIRCCGTIAHNLRRHELRFNSIVGELFSRQHLPAGGVVDAGAHTGENACFYARLAPGRRILAVDPVESNVAVVDSRGLPNVRTLHAGLGRVADSLWLGAGSARLKAGGQLEFGDLAPASHRRGAAAAPAHHGNHTRLAVHTLDELYRAETLAFAHLDVEGEERAVLLGAAAVIARDRPVLTTELHVHYSPFETRALLRHIARLDYLSYLVEGDGSCGVRLDCRNLINVPRERARVIDGLRYHLASSRLVAVNESRIFDFAHPCCTPGGACCRDGPVPVARAWTAENHGVSCCLPKVVHPFEKHARGGEWLRSQGARAACAEWGSGAC